MGQRFQFLIASEKEKDLFYSSPEEYYDEQRGLIGHLRGDFDRGTGFYTTFWDREICAELKTQEFKDELDLVVNSMREPGGVLCNLLDMTAYCKSQPQAKIETRYCRMQYGFKVETERYSYYIRCIPYKGDYNFYIYCYFRERLLNALKSADDTENNEKE